MQRVELTAEERLDVATMILQEMPELPAAARIEVDDALAALESARRILRGFSSE